MNFFIFGGSGFIGSHLVKLISTYKKDSIIYNLDIVESNHQGMSQYQYCDVRDKINLSHIANINSFDVIFNLAAVHRTPGHPDYDYFNTNIKGAESICSFADENNITKIVFTSSIAPYGASECVKYETTLPTPNTPYGISKLVAEKIHQIWQSKDEARTLLILRPGVVFGKGENGNFTRLYWALRKKRFFYPGRKDTIKASIYVKDLVNFMLQKILNLNNTYELYNCTYEPAFTIEEIVTSMKKVTHLDIKPITINSRILILASTIIGSIGGKNLGIHPDRVRKLMISTNINGIKLADSGYNFQYTLDQSIEDWFKDNDNTCLR